MQPENKFKDTELYCPFCIGLLENPCVTEYLTSYGYLFICKVCNATIEKEVRK